MKPRNLRPFLILAVFGSTAALRAVDSDSDGLDDSVETNTGTYVSKTNTGTDPSKPDSDDDGAGDWYEVAIIDVAPGAPQPNSPNDTNLKPNVPYPLPAPDGSNGTTGSGAPPVKVYILSGQSNMQGHGNISPLGTLGTLETITRNEHKFPNLLNGANWSTRNDVIYRGVISSDANNGPLTARQGASNTAIGPELGFGHVMGYFQDEPVLIIKTSQGGRALGWDFLPPGSVSYPYKTETFAGYGVSPAKWTTGTTPTPTNFYAGYQFDQCFLDEADWATPTGTPFAPVTNVVDILDNFATEFPEWAEQGFEIAGFGWSQGWNDGLSYTGQYAYRYKQNMAQFIREVRKYYLSRYPGKIRPSAPFVIAAAAFEGWDTTYNNKYPTRQAVLDGQLAMADPAQYPEFDGMVKTMEARGFWRVTAESPANQQHHYNRNAETYLLTGDALGRGMIDLLANQGTFATWITGFNVGGLVGFNDDPDNDGIPSGLENYFGTNPASPSSGIVAGEAAGGVFTFSHPLADPQAGDISVNYRWSADLQSFHQGGTTDGNGTSVSFSGGTFSNGTFTLKATATGTPVDKIFVAVQATQHTP